MTYCPTVCCHSLLADTLQTTCKDDKAARGQQTVQAAVIQPATHLGHLRDTSGQSDCEPQSLLEGLEGLQAGPRDTCRSQDIAGLCTGGKHVEAE